MNIILCNCWHPVVFCYFYLVYIFRYIEILETSQNIMHSSASQQTTELNEHLTHCQQLKTIIVLDFITVHKGFLFFCSLISIILQNYSSVCVFHCIPRLWPPPPPSQVSTCAWVAALRPVKNASWFTPAAPGAHKRYNLPEMLYFQGVYAVQVQCFHRGEIMIVRRTCCYI